MFKEMQSCQFLRRITSWKKIFFVFTLRQGTILIAVHQIALSALFLLILLTGVSHVDSMLSMLHTDMEDDVESNEYYKKVLHGGGAPYTMGGDPINVLNDNMFGLAKNRASSTVVILYGCTILTCVYLLSCVLLLIGAVKYKRCYLIPWIVATLANTFVLIGIMFTYDRSPGVIEFFGGYEVYYILCMVVLFIMIYANMAVINFLAQMDKIRPSECRSAIQTHKTSELGERMVLIDHTAHSSVLSTTQLNKLQGLQSQFV